MIRAATARDARAIAEVDVRSWLRDYADIVPAQVLAERSVDEREARWSEILGGDAVVLVAEVAGEVVGFVATQPGVLRSLYVAPHAQGAGLGTTLLASGVEALRAGGTGEATLWVFRDNGRARRLYERHGWRHEQGSEALAPREWVAPSVRYRLELA